MALLVSPSARTSSYIFVCLPVSVTVCHCHLACVSPLIWTVSVCLSQSHGLCYFPCYRSSGLHLSACVTVSQTVSLPHHSSGTYLFVCVTVTWPVSLPVSPLIWPVCVCLCHCHLACVTTHSSGLYMSACITVTQPLSLSVSPLIWPVCVCLCHCYPDCVTASPLIWHVSVCVTVTQPLSLSVSPTHLAFMKSQQDSLTSCRWRKLEPTRRD